MSRRSNVSSGLEALQPLSAFVNIGSREHWVCVPDGICENPVKRFEAYTDDLRGRLRLAAGAGREGHRHGGDQHAIEVARELKI